jgi:hypothetical protein
MRGSATFWLDSTVVGPARTRSAPLLLLPLRFAKLRADLQHLVRPAQLGPAPGGSAACSAPSFDLQDQLLRLILHGYAPCISENFLLRMMATFVLPFKDQSLSSCKYRTMADWRRFHDHAFSQERTLALGWSKHTSHRTSNPWNKRGLKEFDPMDC